MYGLCDAYFKQLLEQLYGICERMLLRLEHNVWPSEQSRYEAMLFTNCE